MNPIEHFVRATLGCRCPDEVFRSVSLDHLRTADGTTPYTRLLVGNRLLIYILEAAASNIAGGALADLVARGCRERNELSLNRFRLVVACDEPDSASTAARDAFERVAGSDERAHFHCLPRAELPPAIAP